MSTVPRLETPRLILRPHHREDLEAAVQIWSQEPVYRHITGSPLSRNDVWMRLLRYSGLWDFLGFGYWAVEFRLTGRYIGQMGFADFKRGLDDFDSHHPEAGWLLDSRQAGRGLATEGMKAALAWLDEQASISKSFCLIDEANRPSIRVAEKLGYAFTLATRLGDGSTGVYFRDSE
ncbi:MAG: GNAT family N-acetyltransferase [Pseudomonadota bacterium]